MADIAGEAPRFRKYLLGDLPESEIEELEQGYFMDVQGPQRVDEFWAVFGEVAEEYLNGALSENESRKFERRLRSTPALRELFENEKALYALAGGETQEAPHTTPIDVSIAEPGRGARWSFAISFNPAWIAVTAGAALILFLAWFAIRNLPGTPESPEQSKVKDQKTPNPVTTSTVTPESSQAVGSAKDNQLSKNEPSSKETPGSGKSASNAIPGTTAPFLLLASGEREGLSLPSLKIPAKTEIVALDLELVDEDCAAYAAELRSESKESLRSWVNLRARRDRSAMLLVSLRLEASLLKNADYVIRLNCASNSANPVFVRDYNFKVEWKPSR